MIVFRQRFLNKAIKHDQYLRQEFGEAIADKFLEKVSSTARLLLEQPAIGRQSKVTGIRSKLIPPYVRIYYTHRNGKLIVLNM